MTEPTLADVLTELREGLNGINERLDGVTDRLDRIERQLGRHTEILVQTQEAVHGVQRHLALVPV